MALQHVGSVQNCGPSRKFPLGSGVIWAAEHEAATLIERGEVQYAFRPVQTRSMM